MSKVKICGLKRPQDIQAVNQFKPDYIGFVFDRTRRRYISPKEAAKLKKLLSTDIKAVGVFVNESKEQVADLLKENIIDIAQLHGQETEEQIQWIQEQTGRTVIKAVSVQSENDIEKWADSRADYLLFDNGAGGTGRTFDWSLLSGYTKPYFLAGGLDAGNLPAALAQGPYAVDLSGGAETDGFKDPVKIAEIIHIVRSYPLQRLGNENNYGFK